MCLQCCCKHYPPTSPLLFRGKDCDSVVDSLKTVGGITSLEHATRPTLHMLLMVSECCMWTVGAFEAHAMA